MMKEQISNKEYKICMEPNEHNSTALRLQELSKSEFEISEEQPDINNWKIVDVNGDEIGEVNDLIFDMETKKVRYIVALLDLEEEEGSKQVLVPIGIVDLDESEDEVLMPEETVVFLKSLPAYKSGTVISPAEELAIRYAFLGKNGLLEENNQDYQSHPDDFYTHQHFDDARFKRKI